VTGNAYGRNGKSVADRRLARGTSQPGMTFVQTAAMSHEHERHAGRRERRSPQHPQYLAEPKVMFGHAIQHGSRRRKGNAQAGAF
jgi:hypothetical protein